MTSTAAITASATDQPDPDQAVAGQPFAGQLGDVQQGAEQHDPAQPGGSQPGAGQGGAGQADTARLRAGQPGAGRTDEQRPTGSFWQRWHRLVSLAGLVLVLALAAWQLPVDRLPAWVDQLGPVAPVVAVLGCAVMLSALVPRTAISLACGALFGVTAGSAWALTAALLAAAVTFFAGRWAGREMVAARAGDRLARADAWLAKRGLLAVVVVRLLPIAPFGLVGYAYGASSVRLRHYLLGTAIGSAPSAFSYATIGSAVVTPDTISWLTFVPAASGILISSAAALYWRRTTP